MCTCVCDITEALVDEDLVKRHMDVLLSAGLSNVIHKRGARGVILGSRIEGNKNNNQANKDNNQRNKDNNRGNKDNNTYFDTFRVFPAVPVPKIENTSGAGDSLVAASVWALCMSFVYLFICFLFLFSVCFSLLCCFAF
jgi:sugar/nucleoside kinase (ribokinase family)